MTRQRLPDRRPNETAELEFEGARYAVTIGFFPDGRPGEAFTGNAKVGSGVEAVLDDACILVSLLLQNGVEPAASARAAMPSTAWRLSSAKPKWLKSPAAWWRPGPPGSRTKMKSFSRPGSANQ